MIGHQKILDDLKGLAVRGALGHGYVFFGPAMVGKKLAARMLAEHLETSGASCVPHPTPRTPHPTSHIPVLSDYLLIEPGERNSIGIDAVREIKHFLWQRPVASSRRTLVIDDAELATAEAQNALLKIAEEPPTSSLLILVTSDVEGVAPTILSRLPQIYFGTVAEKEVERWLGAERGAGRGEKKNVAAEIARKSLGKPGLAWRLLHDEEFQKQLGLAEKLLKTPAAARRDVVKKIIEPEKFNFRKFLDAVIMHLAWRGVVAGQRGADAVGARNAALWHRALALYGRETNFSLNPRLQLEALLS